MSSGGALGDAVAAALPPVEFNAFADLAEGYSTNAGGFSGGGQGDDTFTRGRIGLDLNYLKPRLQANASYLLTGQYWSTYHRLNHLSHRLNLTSRTVLVPEMLFLNANAFAAPADLTRVGDLSAGGEPISRYNTRDTYGYSVSPQFMLRFKDYLTSNLSASQGGVFFVEPSAGNTGTPVPIDPARNSYSTTISEQIASGSWFQQLSWSALGSYGQYSQTTRTQRQIEGIGNVTYAATRYLKLFVVGGYSDFHSTASLNEDLSGPTAMGGFTFSQGPALSFTFQAGTQHNFATYTGSAQWEISPLTRFIAQATDGISTPQGDILSRLGSTSWNNGSFNNGGFGAGSGTGYSPLNPGGLALDNSIYRMRSIEASLIHSEGQMNYSLTAFGNERDRLDASPITGLKLRSSVYGLRGTVTRHLNPKTTATLSAAWSRGNEFGGHDNIVSADAAVNYQLSRHLELYLTNHLVHRSSQALISVPNRPLTEDQVLIGIRARL
ncbi:hypothetical protein FHS83_000027 [Rhizomicrobium palustre]|uniref:Porin n=1 Tax=Rhizomicrobium palustre TaxID=189966 RepID=A0A846MTZ9_9PROT|nr:hypothetical protein [Rhizomicrobium palustre]NIK86709.1 hypothetical protein [Rhizomicrobium palustre]